MSWWVWTVVTRHDRLGDFSSKHLFLTVLEAGKPKIKVPQIEVWLLLFSHSVLSDALWPHELQHTRLPCPSPSARVCSSSCLLSRDAIHLSHPLLPLLLLPSVFLSIRVFSSASAVYTRWPKYWSFSFSISPCNEYSGLISFRIDWFDPAVQGTLESLLQHPSLKALVPLRYSAIFIVQLSHLYMTAGKT